MTPQSARFVLTRPPAHVEELDDKAVRELVRAEALERETAAEEKRRIAGRKVLGMRRVVQQDWGAMPRSKEDLFGPEPKVAASSHWARVEALQRNREFVAEYRACLARWLSGERQVVFPSGTYLMRRRFGAVCANAPPG